MFRLFVASALVVALATPAGAKKPGIRMYTTIDKVARADAVVVGKVTGFEKDTVMAQQYPGSPAKVAHKVAVVKVEKGLLGSGKAAEVRVAFVPPPKLDPNVPVRPVRGRPQADLPEGLEGVFFLTRTPEGELYTVHFLMNPLDAKADGYKEQVEAATKAAAALADPVKALKAEKAEDRFLAATTLVTKYRAYPEFGGETETIKVPAEETRLILKGLADGDWSKYEADRVNGSQAFYQLGLTDKDGWVQPVVVNQPGAPPVDFNAVLRDALIQWANGPGKNYQITRIVPKQK